MAAMRTILSGLNGLTYAGLQAGGWLLRAAGSSGSRARPVATTSTASADWCEGPYARGGIEPPLEEVLRDPVVRSLMRADQWQPAEVRRLLRSKQKPLVF